MAYVRKTRDIYEIWTNYGYGWELEDSTYSYDEALYLRKEYRMAGAKEIRIKKKREIVQRR